MTNVYLDNNSTTKQDPYVLEKIKSSHVHYANPSSIHSHGKSVKQEISKARAKIAQTINSKKDEIFFTSGGTESNNWAIKGILDAHPSKKHIITTSVEHLSVLRLYQKYEKEGYEVTYLSVDSKGCLNLESLKNSIKDETALVSIIFANNETGVIFPIHDIVSIVKEAGCLIHVDAVQALGKIPINVSNTAVDSMSFSAHKIYGPKGIGALYVRNDTPIKPLLYGGNQERFKRAGTENVNAIVGFGAATELINKNLDTTVIKDLRNKLENKILELFPFASINGDLHKRLDNTSNIAFEGWNAHSLLEKLNSFGIYASGGSACCAHTSKPSHVLSAMKLPPQKVKGSIRFSLSQYTKETDIDYTIKSLRNILKDKKLTMTYKNKVLQSQNPPHINKLVGLKDLWSLTKGNSQICIAILDGDADLSHPCFQGADISRLDIQNSITDKEHGTHIASIIFGQHRKNNSIWGIAPECKGLIIPIFSNKDGKKSCSQELLAESIHRAVAQGADIINISGGRLMPNSDAESPLLDAIQSCKNHGVLVVAAAGNDGCKCTHIPSALPYVLSVGSMDENGIPLSFSNWGDTYQKQGILALGKNIVGAIPNKKIASKSGTSFSTAIVSGIAALLLSLQVDSNQKVQTSYIRDIIIQSATGCKEQPIQNCNRLLAGRLNIKNCLSMLKGVNMADNQNFADKNVTSNSQVFPSAQLSQDNKKFQNNNTITEDHTEAKIVNNSYQKMCKTQNFTPLVLSEFSSSFSTDIQPSSANFEKVFAIGSLTHDFGTEARRDYFRVAMQKRGLFNPDSFVDMAEYLNSKVIVEHTIGKRKVSEVSFDKASEASKLIWVLMLDNTPIYAILPQGPFSEEVYMYLRNFLQDQIPHHLGGEGADRISIPGIIAGRVNLINGYNVPVLIPDIRGMYSWTTKALVDSVFDKLKNDAEQNEKNDEELMKKAKNNVENFLTRVYYSEIRNRGLSSQERAINSVLSNAFALGKVFVQEAKEGERQLKSVFVEKSSICRPGSDCWDVKIVFFNPKKQMEEANKVYMFTVDVSDVYPIQIEQEPRVWFI